MDHIISIILENVQFAHWIIFGSLLLAGLNLPISEDLMIIISGILASQFVPENTVKIFIFVFLGAYLSDWMIYWMGRTLGRSIILTKWFRKTISIKKLDKAHLFYQKYGFYTLIVGRFIPFGIRNCLFFTAGLGKMSFPRFMLADGIACFISNLTLFIIAFTASKNFDSLKIYAKRLNLFIFVIFISI